jgi:uncharacterized repeat protein (TIGR03803 family)
MNFLLCVRPFPTLLILAASAAAQTPPAFKLLYSIDNFNAGYDSKSGLAIGEGGVLYGTALEGGAGVCNCGTVFSLAPPASPGGAWTENTLYTFTGGSDGGFPSGVVVGEDGVLYGTTADVPTSSTVFSLTPPASPGGAWTLTTLYSFAEGYSQPTGVVIGKGGVLYGTTVLGGTDSFGTVFSLSPPASPGGTWTEATLFEFAGAGGGICYPFGGVVAAGDGVLYGTTNNRTGTIAVYSLTPPASSGGSWTEALLHRFSADESYGWAAGVTIGRGPDGRVVLYGTTQTGGKTACTLGCGRVFSLTSPASPGGSWKATVLHYFSGGDDGQYPFARVTIGSGGALYGTTYGGGPILGPDTTNGGRGTVFQLTPPAADSAAPGAWTMTVLHNFEGGDTDGDGPFAGVAIGKNGVLYGATLYGGTSNFGTVYAVRP